MIEIFQTNVYTIAEAEVILQHIARYYQQVKANFDLEDRDKILRVQSPDGPVDTRGLIALLADAGFQARVL